MKFRSGSEEKVYKFFKDKKIRVKYEPTKHRIVTGKQVSYK